ncbi:MAG TPA: condensation domain-containing protein, partial [Candidatus Deferrimicrobium sp.]|nr:condensation domain-containing protein [Candidatus Deferrimicrobium sp.]
GELEFYNRIDQQVKIRGYRVELGEIEARLMNHENIKDAVVIIFTGNSGDSFLAAYFVADKEPDTTALKEYLKKELPDYMIPTYFIRLEQIPVTPTGKVDRKALPEPGISNLNNYVAPRNPWEEKLAALWTGVLGVNREANPIGIDDDFFRLGGHSLKATMLTARIHKEFDVQVPLLEIFKTPTIRELANYIKNKEKENYRAVEAVEKKEYYPLSSAQKRLYILKQIESVGTGYNIPAVMIIEGGLNKEKLATVCRKLIQRHESFRTSFAILNEEPIQRIHEKVAFEINNYLATDEHGQKSAPEAIIASFIQPFDLSCAPLLRVGLLELEKKDTVLLMIDMHHIISDGTSIGIFINEFSRLYEGKELAPLRIQYRDFSEWQTREKEKSGTRAQAEYWLKEFASDVRDVRDVREVSRIAIPCDFPRPAVQSFAGEKYHLVVGNLETETLKKRAREENVTLFMLLMAIFDIMLWKISGTEDIVVGTPVAGRRHADLESIIGMFVNTLALKVQINPGKENCFGEFLEQVKQKNLDAFENQDYQFEDLVEATQLNRDLGRNPIFDVLFVLQNMGIPVIEIPGLKMTPFPFETHIAPFDIYLMAEEQENCLYFTTGYCTKLFKEDTIRRFMGYFTKILTTVSFERATNLKLTEIEILSVAEKCQILVEFNNTETEYANYSANLTVHELFERQVERTPEAIAVVGTSIDVNDVNNVSITYRELNLKANRLAHRLKQKGVGRDTIVSVIMPRSIDMTAAILGIIKAGGAYLPINPAYPMQRILAILKDNGGRYVLTDSETSRYFPFTVLRGMTWRDISPIVTGRQTQVKNFDSLPHPDRTLVDYRKYHQFIGIAPVKYTVNIQATRGCPYGCAYCHKIWPKTHVSRSAENIFAEIRNCYEAGVKRFVFIDDIFNLHKENSTRLFETIIKNNYNVQLFFPNGLRGDILTPDFIDLMVAAGTVNIDLALETASPRLQKLIGKQLNLEKFAENVHHITKKHPQVILEMEMMIGFPTETEAEAMMTLDLLKRFQWVHFPNLNILKIYPNTDMGKLALANGVSKESIAHSVGLAFHELPETLPFSKDFARKYQAQFMNDYFLSKERLIHVIRNQAKTLSQDELVQKYDSYLPATIKNFQDILTGVGISQEELGPLDFLPGDGMTMAAPGFNERIKAYYPPRPSGVGNVGNVFRVLLMDLSQLFRRESHDALYDVGAEPLGLMYLATYIHEQLGPSAAVKIIKSRIDFDNYEELEKEVLSFKPHLIGIRTLSLYKEFFHRTVSVLKHCGVTAPIITGGPYATSDYRQLLQDYNVDLAVLGEGELTAVQLVKAMINNHNRWPAEEILNTIPGLAYIREQDKIASRPAVYGGEVLLTDYVLHAFHRADHLSADNPENINRPTDLFYLISTSGSTGIPKSVMLEHRTLVNLINYQLTCTGIDFSRVLQFAAIGFDVSLQEIFSALLGGGTVYLPDEEVKRDIPRLCDFIARNGVNILFLPPAFLRFIFSEPAYIREFPRTVQHIIAAGEQLVIDEPLATYLKEKGIFLHNHYGPSETHVVTTLTLEPGSEIPRLPGIGKPIFMTGIYILDKYNHIQPIGVIGELCIGGIQVGRGYLNRPDLTMEKFGQIKKAKITKSFTGVQGGKLRVFQKSPLAIYRTGDLARWLPDGNIEFLGRIDYQVKIRGFRIEPGEIESLLLKYNHVKEALVIDHESKSGEKYLCAYIVPQGDFNIDTGEIRNYLSHQLPDYMIPGHFIFLASIPLNSNRKVDRRALPDPLGAGSSTIAETYIAPANAIEAKLVDIWSEILSIEKSKIGVRDNFFELGGHSLKATLLMAKIHKMLNINIPLAEIFRAPSIRGLAGYLKTAAPLQYIDIEPVEKKSVYPLTYNQKRLWLLQQMDPAGSAYHMPGAIPLAFNVDVQVLKAV